MNTLIALKLAAFAAILVAAASLDLRYRRIPNAVTVGGFVAALVLGAMIERGWPASALTGALVALLVSFPLFALGIMGAGDAKLLTAVGAFLGPLGLLGAALYGGLAGGFIALGGAMRRGVIVPVLLGCKDLVLYLITLGRHGARPTMAGTGAKSVPYGVAIAAGALTAWFFPLFLGGGP